MTPCNRLEQQHGSKAATLLRDCGWRTNFHSTTPRETKTCSELGAYTMAGGSNVIYLETFIESALPWLTPKSNFWI